MSNKDIVTKAKELLLYDSEERVERLHILDKLIKMGIIDTSTAKELME